VASLRAGRAAAWDLARALYEFDEQSGWTALGYETLTEYLADPEVAQSRRSYYRMVRLWEKMVVHRRLPEKRMAALDPSKVDMVIPAIESGKVKMKEALDDVESLGSRDLREKYFGTSESKAKSDEPEDDGELDPDVAATTTVLNDGNDTPQWASDVPEPDPAQNGHDASSGHDVVEGTATEIDDPAKELASLIQECRTALEMPQRLSGARQVVREALKALLEHLERHGAGS
jgi:hypothetical protein